MEYLVYLIMVIMGIVGNANKTPVNGTDKPSNVPTTAKIIVIDTND